MFSSAKGTSHLNQSVQNEPSPFVRNNIRSTVTGYPSYSNRNTGNNDTTNLGERGIRPGRHSTLMPNQTNSGDHQTKAIYDSQPIIKGNTTNQLINLLALKLGGSTKEKEEYI